MSEEQEKQSDLILASKVAARITGMDIQLVASVVNHNPFGDLTDSVRVETRFLRHKVDKDNGLILVKPDFVIEVDYEDSKEHLLIEAEFLLTYLVESSDDLTDDNFDAFAFKNGIYNCWPYLREYVQSISGRLNIKPAITLPPHRPTDTYRVVKNIEAKDEKKKITSKAATKKKAVKKKKKSAKRKKSAS